MIYNLGQVSNRDTQVLYFCRILRHASTNLGEIYRYDKPSVFNLDEAESVTIDSEEMFEYHLEEKEVPSRVPYLEFSCKDETILKHIEDLTELEVKSDELILRGRSDKLTSDVSVSVYWVPSLAYIMKLQKQIEDIIDELRKRYDKDSKLIDRISVNSDYVINLEGVVPNLVNIGKDEDGLIYDDSNYMLSGSLDEQLLINPPQDLVSSILKAQIGTLTIHDMLGESKVYQGFHGGLIRLSGSFDTLVLRDITSIIYLNDLTVKHLVIESCPAVLFRSSIDLEGSSGYVDKLELRNSYVTINQSIGIGTIWCYRMSTVIIRKGTVTSIGFIEAGSNLIYDTPSDFCSISEIRLTKLQGLFYTINPPKKKPYLDEVFLAQKPISFQRSQPEDPTPISEAEVSIYLKHTDSGTSPGPTPGGKIYSPFTDWYWSGDSRTEQLIRKTGTDGHGYGGQGLSKLIEVKSEIESAGVNHNIMLWWGVNGLQSGYASVYKEIANAVGDTAKVFVGTVGHCPDGTGSGKVDGGSGQDLGPFNEQIVAFNNNLKSELNGVSNIVILDIYEYVKQLEKDKGAAWLTSDNLHYTSAAYQMIYDWVCQQITNHEASDWENASPEGEADIMTIYDALRQSGFTRNAAIGALANMKHESGWIAHMIGYNSTYFLGYGVRAKESLLTLMNSATSGEDLYRKIQDTSTNGELTGYGLTQFTSSENIHNLYQFHTSTGLAYDRLGVQIPAFIKVLTDHGFWDTMNAKPSPGDAAYYICMYYEVPKDKETEAAKRKDEADELATRYSFYD